MAKSVRRGEEWREITWSVVIVFLVNFLGVIGTELIHRFAAKSYVESVGYSWYAIIVLTMVVFRRLGFRPLHAVLIASGAGMIVISPYAAGMWTTVLVWALGFVMIVRGFSEGPAPRSN